MRKKTRYEMMEVPFGKAVAKSLIRSGKQITKGDTITTYRNQLRCENVGKYRREELLFQD